MMTIKQRAVARHIEAYYPNARIVSYDQPESGLKFYTKEELAELNEDWFPLACVLDEQSGKIRYGGRAGVVHTYVEGHTGAGKTTRYVMQSIRALSCTKSKPSFLIVDIHGEILPNIYGHLVDQGYEVKVLNCHDPARSNTYNPLLRMACNARQGKELQYDAMSRIGAVLQPDACTLDPIWDQGARAYFSGIVADKVEDVQNGDLPQSCVTLYNVVENHYWLRDQVECKHQTLSSLSHYAQKGPSAYSVQKMTAVLHAPDRTRASYMSVGESKLELVAQPLLYKLSSGCDINVAECIERPTAIVVQSANHMIGDALVSLLVNDIYDEMDARYLACGYDQNSRRLHCFLDEFANCRIASEDLFIRMLTTSRKMGMFWHMLVQSDAQLGARFSQAGGDTIRSNTTEIFMGSMDYNTQVRFAKACGQTTVQALSSLAPGHMPALCVVDVMNVDRLNLVEPGTVFIRAQGRPIMQSYYEAFYNCPDFSRSCDKEKIYPYNQHMDYKQTRFTPNDIPVLATPEEYRVLHALANGPQTAAALGKLDPEVEAEARSMVRHKKFVVCENGMYTCVLSPAQMQLMLAREQMGKVLPSLDAENSRVAQATPDSEQDSNVEMEPDKLNHVHVTAMRNHILLHREQIDYPELLKLTCIPPLWHQVYRMLWEDPAADYDGEQEKDTTGANVVLKYESIESFVSGNDFATKEEWDAAFGREIEIMEKANLFPTAIKRVFKKACDEIQKELTLGNIREIRRIINGQGS